MGRNWNSGSTYCRFLLIASLLFTCGASLSRSGMTFSGELEEVTAASVAIRLADGRIVEARNTNARGELSPHALAERYSVGDEVEIVCAPIKRTYVHAVDRQFSLEVKELRSVRQVSEDERSKALRSPAWRFYSKQNLLYPAANERVRAGVWRVAARPATQPYTAEWSAKFERIRTRVLEAASRMPNFIADEVVKHYTARATPPTWRPLDIVESEVTFKGSSDSRTNIRFKGKPWKSTWEALPASKWGNPFAGKLYWLFSRNCPTRFEPGGWVSEGGKRFEVFNYSAPTDGCERFYNGYQAFFAAIAGRVLLDEREENVVRIETNSRFPSGYPLSTSEQRVSWDFVKIGEEEHFLPVSADWISVEPSGEMRLARIEYKNHRHFEAASSVTFQ